MSDIIPVPDDFEACVQHALDQDDTARAVVRKALDKGLERVYLVGCGGSHFGTYPAFDLLDRYATGLTTQRLTSSELTSRTPAGLNERALVVAASHSGNTPETVAAAKLAKAKGATVASISREGDNGLSRVGDVHLHYPDTISITEPKLVHNEQVALALLEAFGAADTATVLRDSLPQLPGALRAVKDEVAEAGERIADILTDAPLSYIVGGGPAYGMAKMMAWCYFQEMQWMNSAAINGGDFFHGPFEMILEDTPLVVLLAEDASRGLGERVVSFGERYTSRLGVVDTASFSLPGISAGARGDLSVIALMSAERRVLDHVAARRGHDTSVRRYMYKVQY
ncbi:SIS domain-containing protein [Aeromicrobium sp. YIM 150415]|uniref:SIS domain-containing protein n=1 Tax=Aeromicrobium sp. YIM 150415 TaxID=2803912 RepID=UPI001966454B|nr:SIS domain-containing protein [Aeromicrobium sp. YIM 150415]MBM9462294.1 SIS domain-containing protein [Aeromicrobium sp. YIM 150415]